MSLDVSVVVPVFNPGANIDSCIRSLLGQTLAPDHYEIVLVDDGSTDGTADVLDAWAALLPDRVRVFHEPHSGWPGHPRNVGVEHARGDYVHFVDSDDALTSHALERVLTAARESDADIVLPKSASDFRGVNHDLYRHNAQRLTWADFPLVESLVPHKLVRRAFLLEHGLRFADEPRHVEDQLFFAHAYAHATSVAVVADEVCYLFRRRRGFGRNLGDVLVEPDDYYADLERVLDVVDAHTPDESLRARIYERFYRIEILGRLRDRPMLDYDDDYRRRLFARVRRLVDERIPRAFDDALPALARAQAELLRGGDADTMLKFARDLDTLSLSATVDDVRWTPAGLTFALRGVITVPPSLPADLDCTADVVVVGRADGATWFVPAPLAIDVTAGVITITAVVTLDPRTSLLGRPLSAGVWDVRLRTRIGGLTRTSRLAPAADPPPLATCVYDGPPATVTPYWTAAGGLALDVDEWMHGLTRQVVDDAKPDGDRRWRVASVVAPRRTVLQAALFDAAGARTPARLVAAPDGAALTASSRAEGDVWLRVGDPGRAQPQRFAPPPLSPSR